MRHVNGQLRDALNRWLEAERSSADGAADEAFTVVFRAVPRMAPRPGFAANVVRASRRPAGLEGTWVDSWWTRGAVAASLGLAGVAAASVAPVALVNAGLATLVKGIGAGAWLLATVLSVLGVGLGAWDVLASIGRGVGLALRDPSICAGLAGHLFVAAAGFAALRRLLDRQEETA